MPTMSGIDTSDSPDITDKPDHLLLAYRGALLAALLVVMMLSGYWVRQPLTAELSDYNRFECTAGNSRPTLRILSVTSATSQDLAVQLCKDRDIQQQFSSVSIA